MKDPSVVAIFGAVFRSISSAELRGAGQGQGRGRDNTISADP